MTIEDFLQDDEEYSRLEFGKAWLVWGKYDGKWRVFGPVREDRCVFYEGEDLEQALEILKREGK